MKTYQKGRKAELERLAQLESEGYVMESAPKGNRFTKQKDFFDGYWDLVGYKPNSNWIVSQVKSRINLGLRTIGDQYLTKILKYNMILHSTVEQAMRSTRHALFNGRKIRTASNGRFGSLFDTGAGAVQRHRRTPRGFGSVPFAVVPEAAAGQVGPKRERTRGGIRARP